MQVVKKECGKTVFTVELDEDEVGFLAVTLGGVTASFYADNREYIDKVVPQYTNQMASDLYKTFKKMYEGA